MISKEVAKRKEAIAEVQRIAKALEAGGLYHTSISNLPKYVNRLRPNDGIPEAVVAALSDGDDDDTFFFVEVRPIRQWVWFVEHTTKDWTEISESKGEEFEEIVARYGYELGSVGGRPPNFDYWKSYTRDVRVGFAFLGNPYHI
jgi:hypothetical protein